MTGHDFHDRVEEIDVANLDDWIACPNCKQFDTVRVVKDPVDGELSIQCDRCEDETVIVWGESRDFEE